jgi:hypothetical protein
MFIPLFMIKKKLNLADFIGRGVVCVKDYDGSECSETVDEIAWV